MPDFADPNKRDSKKWPNPIAYGVFGGGAPKPVRDPAGRGGTWGEMSEPADPAREWFREIGLNDKGIARLEHDIAQGNMGNMAQFARQLGGSRGREPLEDLVWYYAIQLPGEYWEIPPDPETVEKYQR